MRPKSNSSQFAVWLLIPTIAAIFVATVIVFDIIGVIAVSIADVLTLSKKSMLYLAYPIWFVTAVFTSLFYTSFSLDKLKKIDFFKKSNWIIFCIGAILSAACLYIFSLYGQLNNDKYDYYVPGNAGLTYTFFITLTTCNIFFLNLDMYKKNGRKL